MEQDQTQRHADIGDLGPQVRWQVGRNQSVLHRQLAPLRRQLRLDHGQPVIDRGPYRLMRHPSYTGLFLMALGIAVTLGTWFSVIVLVVPSLISIGLGVRVEERSGRS